MSTDDLSVEKSHRCQHTECACLHPDNLPDHCDCWPAADCCCCAAEPTDTRNPPAKPCCPGAGSMAHVRGCANHPEAGR